MDILSLVPMHALLLCCLVALTAGVVKGLTGFAMPMVMISGMSSFVSPEVALAGLLLPTLATNLFQAFRQGPRAALSSVRTYRLYLAVLLVALLCSAQLVTVIPGKAILLGLGCVISVYAATQLMGWELRLARPVSRWVEASIGAVAGFIGGLSGVWGPPTVAYLTALDVQKAEHVRVQGVIYGAGAVTLVMAHLGSGVLNAQTAPFSLILVPVALAGLMLGFAVQDRIDQRTFRRAILVVLVVAGLNLVRRGLT